MSNRIKFAGHTMGAPGRDIFQCIDLFRQIGYDGIEGRVHTNGQSNSGYVCDEYEKNWYPEELPEFEVGMKHHLEFVKSHLA